MKKIEFIGFSPEMTAALENEVVRRFAPVQEAITLAQQVLDTAKHDKMVLTRLVNRAGYQDIAPVQVCNYPDIESTAYIYSDGSALVDCNGNGWSVNAKHGIHPDNLKY